MHLQNRVKLSLGPINEHLKNISKVHLLVAYHCGSLRDMFKIFCTDDVVVVVDQELSLVKK